MTQIPCDNPFCDSPAVGCSPLPPRLRWAYYCRRHLRPLVRQGLAIYPLENPMQERWPAVDELPDEAAGIQA